MPTEISKLSQEDRDILLRAPAVVAILAAISDDGEVSKQEKSEAIKLSHFRTYSSEPILHNYYKEAGLVFEENFDHIMASLPESWEEKKAYLESCIVCINEILPKLSIVYSRALIASLKSFSRHVFKSNSSFLENFILPIFVNKIENEGFDIKIGS